MEKSNDLNNPGIDIPQSQQAQTGSLQQPVNETSPRPPIQPQSSKKWLIPGLIGLIVLSLSFAVYFAYQNIQLKKQSSSIQPTPTPSFSQALSPANNPVSKPELSNKLISYTTNEGLVVSDIDGNNKKVVFTVKDPYFSWDWNPKANEVVASNAILKNLDTGIEKKVPAGRCHNWSPDGSKIAYEGGGGLFYMNSDGTNPVKITDEGSLCGGSNSVFHWLPDSKSLIYLTNNGATYTNEVVHSIMKYDTSNRSTTKIYQDEKGSGQIRTPSISPDGTKVVFMMSVDRGNNSNQLTENVYIINIDGSGLTQLTNLEAEGEYGQGIGMPIFSTDSKSIFFVSNSTISKYQGLTMLDIQTKTITRLANETANAYSPATISPDGKYVAYDAFGKVVVVNLETKNKTLINNAGFVLWQK
ncbi:PD40 domain-containing protein [Candidatus Daviesbacteria bacterium]|nr:PD40 domain-containing protein [Candidatus Daviesbacteria bacterium]